MKATIKINNKIYSNFNEILYLNEFDSYPIIITPLDNDYKLFNIEPSDTVTTKLEFFEIKNPQNSIILEGNRNNNVFEFNINNNFLEKGYTSYKVFFKLNNITSNYKFNVFLGKLIITTDESELTYGEGE